MRSIVVRSRLVLAAAGLGCLIVSGASGADWGAANSSGSTAPNRATPADDRRQARVQPQAWEFARPDRAPDLSPEHARAVDQLYDQLMRQSSPVRP